MKVNRQAVIRLDGESEHVVNYFRESFLAENPKLADIEHNPELAVLTGIPDKFAAVIAGNHVLSIQYSHALVQKKGAMVGNPETQERAFEVSIPKTPEFDSLIQALAPASLSVLIKPPSHTISFSPEQMSPVFKEKQWESDNFARMLGNVPAHCSEIVLVGKRMPNIQDFKAPTAFVNYIRNGVFEIPAMGATDIISTSERVKDSVPYIQAGVIFAIATAIIAGGYFAFKALAPLFDMERRFAPYGELEESHAEKALKSKEGTAPQR